MVTVEMRVLYCDKSVTNHGGNLPNGDVASVFQVQFRHNFSIRRVENRLFPGLVRFRNLRSFDYDRSKKMRTNRARDH